MGVGCPPGAAWDVKGGAPANAFQVAAESGGAAIDLNDAGVGVHYVSLVHRGTWPALT